MPMRYCLPQGLSHSNRFRTTIGAHPSASELVQTLEDPGMPYAVPDPQDWEYATARQNATEPPGKLFQSLPIPKSVLIRNSTGRKRPPFPGPGKLLLLCRELHSPKEARRVRLNHHREAASRKSSSKTGPFTCGINVMPLAFAEANDGKRR
jgi:hypothetical protein